ncbi:MAG: hypothetical protein Q8P91_01390 [bacterium]|nr:hypothetical protein [bacterium]
MKKLIWFTTLAILFIVFIMPGLMALTIDMIPANDQPGYDGSTRVPIYGDRQYSQKFISRDSNLVAVGTSIKNPNLKNKQDIIFNLYDENGSLIRSSNLNGFNTGDGDFVKFVFGKVNDSLNKIYTFTISSPAAGTEEIIEVFIIEATEDILEYSYGDEIYPGGIPMVTFHKPDSRLEIVKMVYSNWLSKLLSLDSRKI